LLRTPLVTSSVAFAVGRGERLCYPPEVRDKTVPLLPSEALDHLDGLFRLARHLTGDDDDAQDLVQDTYARAFGAQSQFAPGSNVRAWLFRILRNRFVDTYRRRRDSPVRSAGDPRDEDDEPLDRATDAEPLRGDLELERLRAVVAKDIQAALATLSVDARTIVLLDLEGLTEAELAEVLGCNLGTVKSRLSRARAKLRERLRDYAR
jgi:RNA polymerase sigma-70 factor (ECF subfamily)